MPPEVERRLAAILSADVVGYSRLMAADEQATVRRITAYRNEISNLVSDHRGRVVDATGDNALAEFPTALDAVEAAVEIQKVLKVRNEGLAESRRMDFRVGVHLGDVTVEGERIYGDGVNIAARLQGLAEPGGICISGAVHEQVESKLDLRCDDLGKQSVKNIPRPVRVFRVRAEAPSRTKVTGTAATDRPSIVVLPFVNMSADPDQEYFCDGMAEEVINALTQLEGLRVVARTSAFSFKGRDVDIREIGSKLGVSFVLEGSVRRSGDRLRVTAQLVSVEDGFHLWSERFDRQLDDVFVIQDEISASIVEALTVKLAVGSVSPTVGVEAPSPWDEESWLTKRVSPKPARLRTAKRTENQEAYDLYLLGLHCWWLSTEKGYREGLECFQQALVFDPEYARAYAAVAMTFKQLVIFGYDQVDQRASEAESAAIRAIELDESLAEAHQALGCVRSWLRWDWVGAERELRRAIELNPGYALAHMTLASDILSPSGRTEEAVAHNRRAHELDPLSALSNRSYGESLFWDRQYDSAIRTFRLTLDMSPDFPIVRNMLAAVYATNNMPEEALHERQEIFRRTGREKEASALAAAFAANGEPGTLRWSLDRGLSLAEEARRDGKGGNRAWNMSLLYARLGAVDDALEWLSEAVRQRSGQAIYAKVHPWLDSLHSDTRYDEILKTMNLDD